MKSRQVTPLRTFACASKVVAGKGQHSHVGYDAQLLLDGAAELVVGEIKVCEASADRLEGQGNSMAQCRDGGECGCRL